MSAASLNFLKSPDTHNLMISFIRCFAPRFLIAFKGRRGLCVFLLVAYPVFAIAQQSPLSTVTPDRRERVEVMTDTLKITFDPEGGSVVRSEFLKTPANIQLPKNLVLLNETRDRVYLAQSGLIGGQGGGALPTHKTAMTFRGDRILRDGANELVVKFESPAVGGVKLTKTYTFQRGSYVVDVKHEVLNLSNVPLAPNLYVQLVRDGNKESPDQSSSYATFTGPAIYTAVKKYQRVEFREIETGRVDIEKSSPYGYVAMVQHYFASVWMLADGVQRDIFMRKVANNLYAVGMITQPYDIAPGTTVSIDARLFIGPRVESVTTPLRLEAMQDDGWLLNHLQRRGR